MVYEIDDSQIVPVPFNQGDRTINNYSTNGGGYNGEINKRESKKAAETE